MSTIKEITREELIARDVGAGEAWDKEGLQGPVGECSFFFALGEDLLGAESDGDSYVWDPSTNTWEMMP